MANEAVILNLGTGDGNVKRFTVANATAISGGTILKLTDPNTASASSAALDKFAGIAVVDKEASDGSTSIGAYTEGKFDLVCSGAVNLGAGVVISGANLISEPETQAKLLAAISGGTILGKALETGSDGEVIAVAVGVY
jgi:hypothetical protein